MNVGEKAQDAYRRMLREHMAPALRELGFKRGPSLGAFRYETGTHAAGVRFRKSRYSTRQEVDFWAELHAPWIKTEWVYWDWTLDALATVSGGNSRAQQPAHQRIRQPMSHQFRGTDLPRWCLHRAAPVTSVMPLFRFLIPSIRCLP